MAKTTLYTPHRRALTALYADLESHELDQPESNQSADEFQALDSGFRRNDGVVGRFLLSKYHSGQIPSSVKTRGRFIF